MQADITQERQLRDEADRKRQNADGRNKRAVAALVAVGVAASLEYRHPLAAGPVRQSLVAIPAAEAERFAAFLRAETAAVIDRHPSLAALTDEGERALGEPS